MYKTGFVVSVIFAAFISITGIGQSEPWLIGLILSVLIGTTVMDLWFSAWTEWRDKGIAAGTVATLVASGILGKIFGGGLFIHYDFNGIMWNYLQSNETAAQPSVWTAVIYAAVNVIIVMVATSILISPLIAWKARGQASSKPQAAKLPAGGAPPNSSATGTATPKTDSAP